jgi:hypothetical protein
LNKDVAALPPTNPRHLSLITCHPFRNSSVSLEFDMVVVVQRQACAFQGMAWLMT